MGRFHIYQFFGSNNDAKKPMVHCHYFGLKYRPRRDAMLKALKTYMPAIVKWTIPEMGMFIWATFDPSYSAQIN